MEPSSHRALARPAASRPTRIGETLSRRVTSGDGEVSTTAGTRRGIVDASSSVIREGELMTESGSSQSYWLDVCVSGQTSIFELPATGERAIGVGSLLPAAVRIDDPNVALVEFHIEREGDGVWLVPAYGADLRVNAVSASQPCRRR